jgi:hypothetical protein
MEDQWHVSSSRVTLSGTDLEQFPVGEGYRCETVVVLCPDGLARWASEFLRERAIPHREHLEPPTVIVVRSTYSA